MHECFYRVEINPIAAEIFPSWPKESHGAKVLIWQNIHTDNHTFALCGSQNKKLWEKLWRIRLSACSTAYWIIMYLKTCIHAVYLQLMIALGLNNNTRSNKGHTKLLLVHTLFVKVVWVCVRALHMLLLRFVWGESVAVITSEVVSGGLKTEYTCFGSHWRIHHSSSCSHLWCCCSVHVC